MAITDINSENRLVQQTVAEHVEKVLGWESVYACNTETFGPQGTLGRATQREVLLAREISRWLDDPVAVEDLKQAFSAIHLVLRRQASHAAAAAILEQSFPSLAPE